jgi:hypothetical protein
MKRRDILMCEDFIDLIQKVDDSLDRDRRTHSGDYRAGWDDAIEAVTKAIKEYKPKELPKPDSEGWWWHIKHNQVIGCYQIVKHGKYFYAKCQYGESIIDDNWIDATWIKVDPPEVRNK